MLAINIMLLYHHFLSFFYNEHVILHQKKLLGFPGGAAVKNPPANAGDMGSIPGPGRSHMPRSN